MCIPTSPQWVSSELHWHLQLFYQSLWQCFLLCWPAKRSSIRNLSSIGIKSVKLKGKFATYNYKHPISRTQGEGPLTPGGPLVHVGCFRRIDGRHRRVGLHPQLDEGGARLRDGGAVGGRVPRGDLGKVEMKLGDSKKWISSKKIGLKAGFLYSIPTLNISVLKSFLSVEDIRLMNSILYVPSVFIVISSRSSFG